MASERIPSEFLTSGDAGTDLTGKEFRVVIWGSDGLGTWKLAGANARGRRGVLREGGAIGRGVTVQRMGQPKVICGGTFSPGAAVTSDANGAVVLATTGQFAIGYAVTGGAAGVYAQIDLEPNVAP
jgi:hypothetical protein